MAALTEFGKEIRKLRIDRNETLAEMGQKLERSPSFLSAVETGKKAPPLKLVDELTVSYGLASALTDKLKRLATQGVIAFKITPTRESDHQLVAAFARKFETLDAEQRRQMFDILKE